VSEALDGISAIDNDYLANAKAARRIAEEHLDSDLVLGSMLERVGL
jgi:hypothetical protein